ncbi:hypothetical protein F0L74_27100 [Chitinophaga agrisoli]|uniref:Membrane dipeptidase (Peptidase family M19) n=1 Tax=Chitinophaga agrisoli TaxID=2607653 RepID=A0A5B2VNT1_9BACT|nr:hypothetical protein [Chitinophaga agrisoli]KAA2239857.1 hypothetical protein F0L74_27100 [Chitinophaga agrisoli]
MKYFDFHTHIILKQLFDDHPNIDTRISPNDIAGVPKNCSDLPQIIRAQIHQSQLAEMEDEVIIGVALYAVESNLAREVIPLRQFLRKTAEHKLSLTLLNNIGNNTCKSFTDFILNRTLDSYLQAPLSFNVLSTQSFDAPIRKNMANIFFVVEGCHSFVDTVNEVILPDQRYNPEEIIRNLDLLLTKAPVLAVNLTHMQQSSLCNHAFGIQLTKNEPFYPLGDGLTDDGRQVARALFSRKVHVDLKHMSYQSRRELRNEIDAGNYPDAMPLLCTHAGFTGVPFEEWPAYIRLARPLEKVMYVETAKTMQTHNMPRRPGAPAFNMTTINLFDEEIAWIVQHGGMIGLSMDRRILGYVSRFDHEPTGIKDVGLMVDKEYISKAEWISLGISGENIGKKVNTNNCISFEEVIESTEQGNPQEFFYDHILFHIKHYFQVCVNAGIPVATAQLHITIGSDFDGLINPFVNVATVEDMKMLKKYIGNNLRFFLEDLEDSKLWANQLDLTQFVEDLFYNNGFNFVKKWFQSR